MGKVTIDLQKGVYVLGEEVSGILHASLDKSVSQRSAAVRLVGMERTEVSYQAGKYRRTAVEESEFLHQEFPLPLPVDEKAKLEPGNYNIPFRFTLPQGLPITYKGSHAKILYTITAKIDVPLGTDIGESSEFDVVSSPPAFRSGPINACSDSWNNPQNAGVTFDLERCEYRRGEVLSGQCAYRNPGSKNLRAIDVALKWIETARARGHEATTEIAKEVAQVPIGGRLAKGEGHFSISIPQEAPLTFESSLSDVRCILSVSLDIALGSDVAADQTIKIAGSVGDWKDLPSHLPDRQSDVAESNLEKAYQPEYADRHAANVWCSRCGAAIRTPDAMYCPNCGSRLEKRTREMAHPAIQMQVKIKKRASPTAVGMEDCIVCSGELGQDDDVVWCPHCGKLAHREHLMEWIRSKKSCPACGKSLNEEYYE